MLLNIKYEEKNIQILGLRTEMDELNGCYVGQVESRMVGFRGCEKLQFSERSMFSFCLV